ncbi:hypothetical protein V2J09_004936 [Rumex salicifolius]
MGRAPCCEKMGMKKGPWTLQEDQILVSYIQRFGHGNWRALPKQAGLLRCGKSCRLRWVNYLRPDIKRGNFTKEEEEMIIKMHRVLGNRWSIIAAKLPGRTDNEIKNVWHTHLKKRFHRDIDYNHQQNCKYVIDDDEHLSKQVDISKQPEQPEPEPKNLSDSPMSEQCSTITDLSAFATLTIRSDDYYIPELSGEEFWSQVLLSDVTSLMPIESGFEAATTSHGFGDGEERDFWYNLMSKMEEFP